MPNSLKAIKGIAIVALLSAQTLTYAASVSAKNDLIQLKSSSYSDETQVRITGPKNFTYNANKSGGNVSVSLSEMKAMEDGIYKYEFTEIRVLGEEAVEDLENGRGKATRKIVESNKVSGHFRIENGAMVDSEEYELPNSPLKQNHTNK